MNIQVLIEYLRELESFEQKREQIREYAREIQYHTREILDLLEDMMKYLSANDENER